MKGEGFVRRLGFALKGLRHTVVTERSFRVHLAAAAGVLAVLLITRPAPVWWAVLGLAVGFVLMAELFNTALETLADHLHPERHPVVGAAKDIAAAAVLVASGAAAVAGLAFAVDWLVG
ncbi:diacylglycerol kinase [Thauera humireducens]|uniref:diacylglycerol kinase n=1 Tax=Thauera humireducens TaxID=1134435 RepID=UPI00311E26C6